MVEGSQTFEESLLELVLSGKIGKQEALLNADSRTNMDWLLANTDKYRERQVQRQQKFKIEDKVTEDEDSTPALLSVEDLAKIGISAAKN